VNDLFVLGTSSSSLISLTGNIWNRWGGLMNTFLMPGGQWWNGTYEGQPAPDGLYFYEITTLDYLNRTQKFHGTITLIR
jgi:gliding motility-associated-like protein